MSRRDLIQRVLEQTSRDVAVLGNTQRRRVLIALKQAEEELSGELSRWLSGVDETEVFTARRHASLLRQLRTIRQNLSPNLFDALKDIGVESGYLAAEHARFATEIFKEAFTGVTAPVTIDVPAVLSRSDGLLLARYKRSAARYGLQIREWIGRQIAVGVIKQENFAQMTSRIAKLAQQPLAEFGGRRATQMASGLFNTPKNALNRIIRTEAVYAYNTHHANTIEELGLQKRWDSTLDRRGCLICRELDGEIAKIDKPFSSGKMHPPEHPFCRCVIVAWDPTWDHPSLPPENEVEPPLSGIR